eukprot:TRINITY_DN37_c2_g1_i1.p1 TRINITY_DN37_c2_g1~~TRINITY_DN37_c2_g1_i1.p1  ORF type:complete len:490 (+),score=100.28 TRINITY_DN37_c2_g1_i1:60-1529(+)
MPAMNVEVSEVPIKFELVRNGEVVETRRVRLVNPSFSAVLGASERWSTGVTVLQYADDDGDMIMMDTEEEWGECMRLWNESVNRYSLRLRLVLPHLEDLDHVPRWWARGRSNRDHSPDHARKAVWKQSSVMKRTREAKEGEVSVPQAAVVEKALKLLHGEDAMVALASGEQTPESLGCNGWLSAKTTDIGEVDLDVKVKKLYNLLCEKGNVCLADGDAAGTVWFRLCRDLEPTIPVGWYNLACAMLALEHPQKESEEQKEDVIEAALNALQGAVGCGHKDWQHMATDTHLELVRDHPGFLSLYPKKLRGRFGNGQGQSRSYSPVGMLRRLIMGKHRRETMTKCKSCDFITTGVVPEHCCWECLNGLGHGPLCRGQAFQDLQAEPQNCTGCGSQLPQGLTGVCCKMCSKHNGGCHGKHCVLYPKARRENKTARTVVPAAEPEPEPLSLEVVYADQIKSLQSMGFTVDTLLLTSLQQHDGDLFKVVNSVLL